MKKLLFCLILLAGCNMPTPKYKIGDPVKLKAGRTGVVSSRDSIPGVVYYYVKYVDDLGVVRETKVREEELYEAKNP